MSQRLGETQRKILLLLLGGIALGLSGSPKRYFQVLKAIEKDWKEINKQSLKRAIKSLYESKLVSEKENPDGSVTLVLTDKGKQKALTYDLDKMEIKKSKQWDLGLKKLFHNKKAMLEFSIFLFVFGFILYFSTLKAFFFSLFGLLGFLTHLLVDNQLNI